MTRNAESILPPGRYRAVLVERDDYVQAQARVLYRGGYGPRVKIGHFVPHTIRLGGYLLLEVGPGGVRCVEIGAAP
jgi:hypothetical protein